MSPPIVKATAQRIAAELDALFKGSRHVTVLAGAGISMLRPSNLPSGPSLLQGALEAVVTDPKLRMHLPRSTSHERWSWVVPEEIFQRILDVTGWLPLEVFAPLSTARPNRLHGKLAQLGESPKCSLVTTNFDPLLSVAGVSKTEVLYLHGRIDMPSSLVTTIRAVGSGLQVGVRESFRAALAESDAAVVLGYSGNDSDVMEHVEALAPREVVWIVRSTEDYALRNLNHLNDRTRLRVLAGDLSALQSVWGRDPSMASVSPPSFATHPGATMDEQAELTAGVLQAIDAYPDSILVLREALQGVAVPQSAADLGVLLAHAYNGTGDQPQAGQAADNGLRLSGISDDARCRLLTERGLAALDNSPPDLLGAGADLREALRIAPDTGAHSDLLMASALHNLAYFETIAYITDQSGDLAKAGEGYVQAVALKRRAGDLPYLHTSLRNGAAVLRILGDDARADELEREFHSIAARYSFIRSRAYYPALMARLFMASGDSAAAEPLLREAIGGFVALGDQPMVDKLEVWLSECR